MKTLEEHNKQEVAQPQHPRPNGIACPKCGAEMSDTSPEVLCSIPPKKNVECPKCGHRDFALA